MEIEHQMKNTQCTFKMLSVATILLLHMNCKDYGVAPPAPNWEPLGLEGKLVSRLRLIDDNLYACATRDGLYRLNLQSTNAHWEYLGLGDSLVERELEKGVTDIVVVGSDLLVSYAASEYLGHHGIYRSTDAGLSWQPSDSGLYTSPTTIVTSLVTSLGYSPQAPGVLFAAMSDAIYKSNDSGHFWILVDGNPQASSTIYAVKFNPQNVNEIWAAEETGRFAPYVRLSTDQGLSWDRIPFPPNIGPYTYDNAVYDIAFDKANDSVLYFGMLGVIVKSTDKARTFQRILGWEDGIYRHWRLAMNPSNAQEILASGFYLYRTLDGGNTWQRIRPPFFEIYALAVDWQQRVLFVSVSSPENGVYKLRF
jgi:hypothetical protein